MVGVNKVILIGNLGKDPEIIAFPQDVKRADNDGRSVELNNIVKKATFPLATTEVRKNRDGVRVEQTDWHNIVCWRGLAEIAEKLLHKGTQVYVEGKLQNRSWEDKEGNKRYVTEIVAENFTILGNRQRNEEQAAAQAGNADPYSEILKEDTAQLGDLPF